MKGRIVITIKTRNESERIMKTRNEREKWENFEN